MAASPPKGKRVLVLTYYWPPSGGSGVQRWLKFVRYLRETGWEPVVYTALNGEYPVLDPRLEAEVPAGVEVIRTPIWEPYHLYKKLTGARKGERVVSGQLSERKKSGRLARLGLWVRGNFFIPDARKFWIKPSTRFLLRYLREHPVQAIASTGPPHTMHMIGLRLHRATGIPWLADFRDPWTNIDFYRDLQLSRWADRKHHRMERQVVTTASQVVVVGRNMQEEFEALSGRKVAVVTNGYDEADIPSSPPPVDTEFSLVHIGMMGKDRNHEVLWRALGELVVENAGFAQHLRIKLVGKVDAGVHEHLERHGLKSHTTLIDQVTHSEAVALQARSQLLLLSVNNTPNAKGILTGKIFEYLASGRPVLCIGPEDGDAAEVLRQAQAGDTVGFEDRLRMKQVLLQRFELYQAGKNMVSAQGVARYSRRALTHQLASLLNEMTAS